MWIVPLVRNDLENASLGDVIGAEARRTVGPGARSARGAMRQVLEQVELGDNASGLLTADRHERGRSAAEQGERLVERRRRVDERQWPLHDLADRTLDDRRIAVGLFEQRTLADRADEAGDRISRRVLGYRHLADPIFLERRDPLADPLRGPRHDDRRPAFLPVAMSHQL